MLSTTDNVTSSWIDESFWLTMHQDQATLLMADREEAKLMFAKAIARVLELNASSEVIVHDFSLHTPPQRRLRGLQEASAIDVMLQVDYSIFVASLMNTTMANHVNELLESIGDEATASGMRIEAFALYTARPAGIEPAVASRATTSKPPNARETEVEVSTMGVGSMPIIIGVVGGICFLTSCVMIVMWRFPRTSSKNPKGKEELSLPELSPKHVLDMISPKHGSLADISPKCVLEAISPSRAARAYSKMGDDVAKSLGVSMVELSV
jgi:hypothetical protein